VKEKRKSPRKMSQIHCSVVRLFTHSAPVSSKILNYSANGLMIVLDFPLPPGDGLVVSGEPGSEVESLFGSARCIGMVRWCTPQHGAHEKLYGVGVELACSHVNSDWT
jgi:hypothetical protein